MPRSRPFNTSLGREYGSLRDLVYRRLRDQILWGAIPPGSRLSVRGLAERLAVSPMPVRDALLRLAGEELVEITPRSSTRVAQISPKTIQELFLLRRQLEPLAARLALGQLTPADIRRLKGFQVKLERAAAEDDPEEWHHWNQKFHFLVFERSGNTQLERIAKNIWDRNFLHFSGRALTQAGFRDRRAKEHRQIVQAILRHDPDATETAWREHIVQSEIETVEYLRQLTPKIPKSFVR